MICPPPGKSGPGISAIKDSCDSLGFLMSATAASATSVRLCEGISVARPTAMPDAPFSKTKGSLAGNSLGSSLEQS